MTSPDTEFISILSGAGNPEAPARVSAHSLPQTLPILGLSDIVIFPGMVAPLLVETPQSTKLIDDVVAGDRLLGVALQRKPEAENPTPEETLKCVPVISRASKPPIGAMATLARISPAHFAEENMAYKTMKITRMVMGRTIISRFWERFWLSYSPAQSM